ncbi:MAG: hypothetical protein WDO24_13185 [Pseudomonadota bacterium]
MRLGRHPGNQQIVVDDDVGPLTGDQVPQSVGKQIRTAIRHDMRIQERRLDANGIETADILAE